ncbi:MAG: hydrogenase maturation protease [Candidatus Bathyarchaeota archaeon]|nr:hydrogenase maturation protease [Candidatus Bathyarchaeota archaeon]
MRVLVAGVGSLLRSDDGLGPHVIMKLSEVNLPSQVDIMDLGTSGMDILHYSRNYDKVIFVDAIKLGMSPGSVYRIIPSEVKVEDGDLRDMIYVSMHEINLEKVIAIGRKLGDMPKEIVIIGCEPEDTTTMKIGLAEKVNLSIPKIIELIKKEIPSEP